MKSFSPKSKFGKRDSGRSSDRDSGRSRDRDSGEYKHSSRSNERSSFRDSDKPRSFGRSSDRDSDRSRDFGRSGRRESSFGSEKQMHRVTCDKCGAKCEVPFRPTEGKPVYCSACFRKEDSGPRSSPRGQDMSSGELDKINRKLDKILKALNIE